MCCDQIHWREQVFWKYSCPRQPHPARKAVCTCVYVRWVVGIALFCEYLSVCFQLDFRVRLRPSINPKPDISRTM